MNLYLRERGDAAIRSNADLLNNSKFHEDPTFPDRKRGRENVEKVTALDMADRLLLRFSVQRVILQCMAERNLDALVYPEQPPAAKTRRAGWSAGIGGRRGDGVVEPPRCAGFPRDHRPGRLHHRDLRFDP